MMNMLKRYKWPAAGGMLAALFIIAVAVMSNIRGEPAGSNAVPAEAAASSSRRAAKKETKENDEIVIDLKGAVKKPGVYEMRAGERVHHLLKKAGGTVKNAEEKQVNLAAVLQDGMVIYIPYEGEEGVQTGAGGGSSATAGGEAETVNINTASTEELQAIPGVGPSKAEAITAYREENGPFQTVEDITNVSGIGEKTFEKIKSSISVK
ncbi:helix-hairpin-helix domain-containing protein [Bacillus glycinifermentans]|nr:helix-hairpin-helix domain-containing protein [Bacillus glycinifermentans]UOY89891.1 helix-hairpin-helix domain-containing protein [Bacillus glycinifermentans]